MPKTRTIYRLWSKWRCAYTEEFETVRPRKVYVIEWLNNDAKWITWDVYHVGYLTPGLPFFKKRLRSFRRKYKADKFRLVRYVPEKVKR